MSPHTPLGNVHEELLALETSRYQTLQPVLMSDRVLP